ncbi:MAG TPA: hypothetical protein VK071_10395 [Tissierellales bacterium]|nr:hypothetical protein [Tissierellales bacterium]
MNKELLKNNKELLYKIDKLHETFDYSQKVMMLLEALEDKYFFIEAPRPELIFDASLGADNIERQQAIKWNWDYHLIVGYIDIVKDYTHQIEKTLSDVLEKEDK